MNKDRRNRITEIQETLDLICDKIEDLQSEEQAAFDAMPESLQQGERGLASEAAIEALQSAFDSASDAVSYLETASE